MEAYPTIHSQTTVQSQPPVVCRTHGFNEHLHTTNSVGHSTDDAAQYTVPFDGVSDRIPQVARISGRPGRSRNRADTGVVFSPRSGTNSREHSVFTENKTNGCCPWISRSLSALYFHDRPSHRVSSESGLNAGSPDRKSHISAGRKSI